MAQLKICTFPDPILKKKAEPLTVFAASAQQLFDDMIDTMYGADGVGLAAPQVGIARRVLVASPTMERGEEFVIVNPEIYESRGRELGPEGCLSLPGISGEIARATLIRLRYQNRRGEALDMEVRDFFARIIQHEIDHLDGILLIDRLDFDRRQRVLADYQRL